jgi:hypothetical protein
MRLRFLLLLVGLALVPGCAKPTMAPVKGRVTCHGKPVADAAVTFAPVPRAGEEKEPGKAATGFTDAEGNFTLSTYRNYDGALIGQHSVTVSLDDRNPARCSRTTKTSKEVKPGRNEIDIDLSE